MTWILWRQHRVQLAVLTAALTALALLLVPSGHTLGHANSPFAGHELETMLVNLSVAVPLLLGVFLGVSLLGREFEQGTNLLAWSQTISRRRWLATKLTSVLAFTVLASTVLSVLATWWARRGIGESRFSGLRFDTADLAPIGYSVFAVALGFAAGAVLRRVMPAVATTVGGFFAVRLFVELTLRPRFHAPVRAVSGLIGFHGRNDWVLSSRLLNPDGSTHDGPLRIPDACAGQLNRSGVSACVKDAGYRVVTRYQPGARYWTFQWTEAAIFVGLAALLVVVGAVAVLRRDA